MTVAIELTDRRRALDTRGVRRAVEAVLRGEDAGGKTVDIVFCGDKDMVRLNRKFKGKNRSTDVLAFDMSGGNDPDYLGEIYVNLQMARRQADLFDVPYSEEVLRLAIHGVLHLLGFRDNTGASRARMWARQERYVEKINHERRRR